MTNAYLAQQWRQCAADWLLLRKPDEAARCLLKAIELETRA